MLCGRNENQYNKNRNHAPVQTTEAVLFPNWWNTTKTVREIQVSRRLIHKVVFLYFVAYLSPYHEKAISAVYALAYELPAICLPHQDGVIPLSAFPNGTTSKLAGLSSTLSL